MEMVFTLFDIEEAAGQFLVKAGKRKVVAVHGDIGSGKTTFIHAICTILGVKDIVGSPTFSIINEYESGKLQRIYHIDLYRVKDEAEAIEAGVEECIYSGQLCFIEWPEKVIGLLPETTVHMYLSVIDENKRRLIAD